MPAVAPLKGSGSASASRMILAAMVLQAAAGPLSDQTIRTRDFHRGLTEYELSCMPCHGIDGHGDGPRAKSLTSAPADLTRIAKANNGVFPSRRLAQIIDGRALAGAHGPRDMPVWGNRYRVRVEAKETDATIERRATEQIDALVRYLRSIQAK